MPDTFWGSIKIGGKILKKDLPQLIEALEYDCLLDEEKCASIDPFKIYRNKDGTLYFEDNEAHCGMFERVEKTCRELGLVYVRQSDSYADYDAELNWFDENKKEVTLLTDQNGWPIVRYETLRELINALDKLRTIDEAPLLMENGNETEKELAKYFMSVGSVPDPITYLKVYLNETNHKEPTPPPFEITD